MLLYIGITARCRTLMETAAGLILLLRVTGCHVALVQQVLRQFLLHARVPCSSSLAILGSAGHLSETLVPGSNPPVLLLLAFALGFVVWC